MGGNDSASGQSPAEGPRRRGFGPMWTFVGVGAAVPLIMSVCGFVVAIPLAIAAGPGQRGLPPWFAVLAWLFCAVPVAALAMLGARTGRRFRRPVPSDRAQRLRSVALPAALSAVGIVAWLLVPPFDVLGPITAGVWLIAAVPMALAAVWLVRRGRPRTAVLVAVSVALCWVAVLVIGVAALASVTGGPPVAESLGQVVRAIGTPGFEPLVVGGGIWSTANMLLTLAGAWSFTLASAVSAARARPPRAAAASVEPVRRTGPGRVPVWYGVGLVVAGIGSWAATAAFVSSKPVSSGSRGYTQFMQATAWAYDQRIAAVLLVVLGLGLLLAQRRGSRFAAAAGAALLVADAVAGRIGGHGPLPFAALLGIGAVIATAAFWWGRGDAADAETQRRRLVRIAAVAALTAPALFWAEVENSAPPTLLRVVTIATVALLTATAAIAALAARWRRLPVVAAVVIVVLPALLLAGLAYAGIGVPQRLSPLLWTMLAAAPLAGAAASLVGRMPGRSSKRTLQLRLGLAVSSLVLALPVGLGWVIIGGTFGEPLAKLAGVPNTYVREAIPIMIGAVAVAAVLSSAVARLVVPRTGPEPVAEPRPATAPTAAV